MTMVTIMPDTSTVTSQLRLWQLISPALPVGAYAYSGGLEYAIDAGWVRTLEAAQDWIGVQLREVQARLDVPVFLRLHAACVSGDEHARLQWNALLRASRESAELRAEDTQLGAALLRLLIDLDVEPARGLATPEPTFALAFALAAVHWGIEARAAAEGLLWAWCENQVAAAVKLVPLGQTDGQRLLLALSEDIDAAVQLGLAIPDDAVGASAPGVAVASALHETQYTR
ncbi:MAG TPA: urease accessory protein UreF, partial [Thioalkalivibrio sp.]|nr:urease accessory protein UreF [Thioalkalivibrio sp.]